MLRALYDRTMAIAGHRHAMWGLALVAFVESSVFPIPPDVLIIPMVMAARSRAWLIAGVATLASVAGGALGYAIGYGFYETLGRPVLEFYGQSGRFAEFQQVYNELGWWLVIGAGLTPFPYKVITIASGVTGLDFFVFMAASVIGRAGRFFLVAALLWYLGPPVRVFIEKNLGLVTTIFFVCLFGGFLAVRYLF